MTTLDSLIAPGKGRDFPLTGSARYKLPLRLRSDRAKAAELLWKARRLIRGQGSSWWRNLILAKALAHDAAGKSDPALRVYDHLGYVIERTANLDRFRRTA